MKLYVKPHIYLPDSARLKRYCSQTIIVLALLFAFVYRAPAQVAAGSGAAESQKSITNPDIAISGKIQETTDFFGRKRFIGNVVNKEKVRIDFIKIEFTLRDREGKVLETIAAYIKGQRHMFYNRQVSNSSLAPGKTGTFNIIASTPAESVFSYTYKITGKHFIYP